VFVEQIGRFDQVCLLLGLEVGEWCFGDLSVSLSGVKSSGALRKMYETRNQKL
jgi:hypothetical protein